MILSSVSFNVTDHKHLHESFFLKDGTSGSNTQGGRSLRCSLQVKWLLIAAVGNKKSWCKAAEAIIYLLFLFDFIIIFPLFSAENCLIILDDLHITMGPYI